MRSTRWIEWQAWLPFGRSNDYDCVVAIKAIMDVLRSGYQTGQ